MKETKEPEPVGEFRDLKRWTNFVTFLLCLCAFSALAQLWSNWTVFTALDKSLSFADARRLDHWQVLTHRASLGCLFGTVPFFARWLVLAHRNLRPMEARDLVFEPGWVVGFYFVPLMNLWAPLQAMVELWRASLAPANWRDARLSLLVPIWWLLWIGSGAVRLFARLQSEEPVTREVMKEVLPWALLSIAMKALGACVAILLIRRIAKMQGDFHSSQTLPTHEAS